MNLRLRPYIYNLKTFVCLAATFIAMTSQAALDAATIEDEIAVDTGSAEVDTPPSDAMTSEAITPEVTAEDPSKGTTAAVDEGLVEDLRDDSTGLVEMHYPIDVDLPYKYRRENSAFTLGVNYENFYPENFVSLLNTAEGFKDMFGESEVPMMSFDLGYKYNFSLGAFVLGAGVGIGRIHETSAGVDRSLQFVKYNGYVGYIMDSIFNEPYVAPYVHLGATQFGVDESADVMKKSTATEAGFFYKVGAMIQLNWLEPESSRSNLLAHGLQNTFLDIFVTQYSTSVAKDDPDIETGINYGAGLRVEF